MARTAEHSLRGYLYQFLRYLLALLDARAGETVTIEGAIEDIDVSSSQITRAIQCKYHGSSDTFALSKIYKPLLLMLEHFGTNRPKSLNVNYHLFCHFPGKSGSTTLTAEDLQKVIDTKNEALSKTVSRIPSDVALDQFLSQLTIEFGPTLENLEANVISKLREEGFDKDDVDAVIFPAALQRIVDTSIKSTVEDRSLTREVFLSDIREIKHVTFTRWTRELSTKRQILLRLRLILKSDLSFNSRRRVFAISPSNIVGFNTDIVKFIKAFVDRYSFKYVHKEPPLFVFLGNVDLTGIESRLLDRGIVCATGMIGARDFRQDRLFRAPMMKQKKSGEAEMEFQIRLAHFGSISNIEEEKQDDIFLVNCAADSWDLRDVNVYSFEIEKLSELEFILLLRDSYV